MNKAAAFTKSSRTAQAYKNPALPAEKRVKGLLARMTLPEKAAQMIGVWQEKAAKLVDAEGNFDFAKAKAAFKQGHGLGQVGRPSDAGSSPAPPAPGKGVRGMAELTNAIQKFFLEKSRLGIPVMFHEECLHGQAARDATSFCQPIGLGATFNPALVEELFTMTAYEARSRGTHQPLTSVVDVAGDPRWERVEETYGEDPYLVAQLGCAAVRGFQGDATFTDKRRVSATMKHFVAHGQPESGMNCAPANVSLRETVLAPFKAAVQKAGAITRAFRREGQGRSLQTCRGSGREHRVARTGRLLVELVRKSVLKEKQLDELVAPMLLWKFKLGLFDDPFVEPHEADRVVGCEAYRQFPLRAAHETITLLKNENHLAPLNPSTRATIAVIGPNANRSLQGGYSACPRRRHGARRHQSQSRRPCEGAPQRRLQDHGGRRLVAARRSSSQRSRR